MKFCLLILNTKFSILFVLVLIQNSLYAHDLLKWTTNYPKLILTDLSKANESFKTDSLEKSAAQNTYGVFVEVLGKDGLYSVGYEYCKFRNKHAFGIGGGTSFWRPKVYGTIPYNQFSLSVFPFYEYGKIWGLRTAISISGKINPIMFTSRLDDIVPADKPSYVHLSPSLSSGIFYKPQQSPFQFILNFYGMYSFARIQAPSGDLWTRYNENYFWIGLTIKHNLKN